MNKRLTKYLATRAIAGSWEISALRSTFNSKAAIVIPALAESKSLPLTLAALAENPAELLQQTLIVVVINNRAEASENDKHDNLKTLTWLRSEPCPNLNLVWVDAASSGRELPGRDGVGLARKIGFDLSLNQLDWSNQPFLISLDADTLVDRNYLPALFNHFRRSACGAAVVPFRHQFSGDHLQEEAIRSYERYLRSYLCGLQLAGSPYAFHTIGSAFVCRAKAYVAAGGMNRRHAAEDFYFLQQLAKVCGVETVTGTIVQPSPRFSSRVPFGTGRAVQAQVNNNEQLFHCPSVDAFKILKAWIDYIGVHHDSDAESVLEGARKIAPELHEFLSESRFIQVWTGFQRQHSERQRCLKAFHDWFDALKTRQLLTRCEQDDGVSLTRRVEDLLTWGGYSGCADAQRQLALLEQLQLEGCFRH